MSFKGAQPSKLGNPRVHFLSLQTERKYFHKSMERLTRSEFLSNTLFHTRSTDDLKIPTAEVRLRARSQSGLVKPASLPASESGSTVTVRVSRQVFTQQQKELLRHSWRHLGKHGPSGIGAMIFRRIFENHPEIRRLFGVGASECSGVSYNKDFECHIKVFVAVLDGAIKCLDDLNGKYAPLLMAHGKNHTKFVDRGFKPEYWDAFAEAMTESAMEWVGPGRHRETIRAWTILVSYITDKMRFGFETEMKASKKAGSNGSLSCPQSPMGSRDSSPCRSSPKREDNDLCSGRPAVVGRSVVVDAFTCCGHRPQVD